MRSGAMPCDCVNAPVLSPNSAHWPVPMAVHRMDGAQAIAELALERLPRLTC